MGVPIPPALGRKPETRGHAALSENSLPGTVGPTPDKLSSVHFGSYQELCMKYGAIQGIDKPVSRLIQGTMMLKESKADEAFALLDAADSEGVRAFDYRACLQRRAMREGARGLGA